MDFLYYSVDTPNCLDQIKVVLPSVVHGCFSDLWQDVTHKDFYPLLVLSDNCTDSLEFVLQWGYVWDQLNLFKIQHYNVGDNPDHACMQSSQKFA